MTTKIQKKTYYPKVSQLYKYLTCSFGFITGLESTTEKLSGMLEMSVEQIAKEKANFFDTFHFNF
jgi:hypothetical protein